MDRRRTNRLEYSPSRVEPELDLEGAIRCVKEVVVEKGYLTAAEADRLLDARALTAGGIRE